MSVNKIGTFLLLFVSFSLAARRISKFPFPTL